MLCETSETAVLLTCLSGSCVVCISCQAKANTSRVHEFQIVTPSQLCLLLPLVIRCHASPSKTGGRDALTEKDDTSLLVPYLEVSSNENKTGAQEGLIGLEIRMRLNFTTISCIGLANRFSSLINGPPPPGICRRLETRDGLSLMPRGRPTPIPPFRLGDQPLDFRRKSNGLGRDPSTLSSLASRLRRQPSWSGSNHQHRHRSERFRRRVLRSSCDPNQTANRRTTGVKLSSYTGRLFDSEFDPKRSFRASHPAIWPSQQPAISQASKRLSAGRSQSSDPGSNRRVDMDGCRSGEARGPGQWGRGIHSIDRPGGWKGFSRAGARVSHSEQVPLSKEDGPSQAPK